MKTPSSTWHENGEPDPHAGRYDCERHELDMGDLTDDQLANAVFMYGNETPRMEQVVSGAAKMPIVWLTAAKSRIRWLSRRLQKREDQTENMALLIRQLARKLDKANPGNELSRNAMVYLANNGFKADLLRKRPGLVVNERTNPCSEVSMPSLYGGNSTLENTMSPISLEIRAREIYESWNREPGYLPWIVGGNSKRQEEARRLAREELKLKGP